MKKRIAINGFGRIGRLVLRAMLDKNLFQEKLELVAVNDLVSAENLAYLLKYDTIHRKLDYTVTVENENRIVIKKGENLICNFEVLSMRVHPTELPWEDRNIDVVIESTGAFTKLDDANGHISAGAKKVIITAPSTSNTPTYLVGVNEKNYSNENVISNASCTTNCMGPLIQVLLQEGIGVKEGFMTTIHAYTASQELQDGPSKSDFRKGRAAATNIIPTTTGATDALGLAIPEIAGKLTGMSFRVPVQDVSCIDFVFKPERKTSLEEIKMLMKKASETYLKGILEYNEDPTVSSDYIGNPHSAIFDAYSSIELNDEFFKLIAWYDNEWGYSNRIAEMIETIV